jgi:hypothetical protein
MKTRKCATPLGAVGRGEDEMEPNQRFFFNESQKLGATEKWVSFGGLANYKEWYLNNMGSYEEEPVKLRGRTSKLMVRVDINLVNSGDRESMAYVRMVAGKMIREQEDFYEYVAEPDEARIRFTYVLQSISGGRRDWRPGELIRDDETTLYVVGEFEIG